jgi:hypothetical protein
MYRFQNWGQPVPHRPVEDNAFAVARFFQRGGSFHNYYMVGSMEPLECSVDFWTIYSLTKIFRSLKYLSHMSKHFYCQSPTYPCLSCLGSISVGPTLHELVVGHSWQRLTIMMPQLMNMVRFLWKYSPLWITIFDIIKKFCIEEKIKGK